jgi:hypothetical protein
MSTKTDYSRWHKYVPFDPGWVIIGCPGYLFLEKKFQAMNDLGACKNGVAGVVGAAKPGPFARDRSTG